MLFDIHPNAFSRLWNVTKECNENKKEQFRLLTSDVFNWSIANIDDQGREDAGLGFLVLVQHKSPIFHLTVLMFCHTRYAGV